MGGGALARHAEKSKQNRCELDGSAFSGHSCGVKTKYLLMTVSLGLCLCGEAVAQKAAAPKPVTPKGATPNAVPPKGGAAPAPRAETVPLTAAVTAPPDVVASAVAAVDKLGSEVTHGNFAVAIERMNPLWKERLANQTKGGMPEVVKQIEGASKRLAQEGVSIISFVHLGTPRSFEVCPGTRKETVKDETVEIEIFTKWLVFVPTLTKYRLTLKGNKEFYYIEKVGFQVAVSDKGKNDWTFIDGSGLTLNTLRRLYVTLPRDLELPPIEERKADETR